MRSRGMWIVGLGKLALFFVSTGFLAAGIFLLPMIAGREPPRQHWLAYALLVALAVVVFGSLIGEFISIHGGWRYVWHRSKQIPVAGFKYRRHHDVWECPTGQQLRPITTDPGQRLIRYRAPAHICNKCSIKHLCTESDEGREIEHDPGSWLESEPAKFHRGISLALLFLAGLLLVVEMIRHQRPMELLILSGFLVPVAFLGSQLSSAFFAARR